MFTLSRFLTILSYLSHYFSINNCICHQINAESHTNYKKYIYIMAYDIKLMSLLITANVTESFEFSCIQVLLDIWIA